MEQVSETNQAATADVAGKLAEATQAMADALHNINAQFESLHAKIDRIVASVGEDEVQAASSDDASLREKLASAEKANHDLKAQAERARRKTLSPLVTTLLAKEGVEGDALIEGPVVEKALSGLSIEQRIAVKAELARAGVLV
jgi:small-conductance mechanosensitive channel